MNVIFCVQIEPVFKSESTKLMEHLFLLEKVDLLSLLTIALLVESNEFKEQVLSDLEHGLRHVDLSSELRMDCQEWCTVQLLKCGHEHDLEVLDSEYIEMSKVELCGATIDKQLAINAFEEGGTVRCLSFRKLVES